MYKIGLEKAKEPEIKLPTFAGSYMEKAREFQKNIYFCSLILLKYLTVWITKNWKILKEIGILGHLIRLLSKLYASQEATVRIGHGTTNWFQLGKEFVKAEYCHPAYLTYMQSTSCEMPGWMNHKLE